MRTDENLKNMVSDVVKLRCYDDINSLLLKISMIEELTSQIKKTIIHN